MDPALQGGLERVMTAQAHIDQGTQRTRRTGRALGPLSPSLSPDDPRVLPQPAAIEARAVDKPGSARNGRDARATSQHSRGERVDDRILHADTVARPDRAVTPLPSLPAFVFVLDARGNPLMPCHPARARELLRKGRAVPVRSVPFVIRLKDRVGGDAQPVRIGIDPGSKTTGIAVVRDAPTPPDVEGDERVVLWMAELTHRGSQVRDALTQRRNGRKRRRSANLRYRAARFDNRTKPAGWLAPSLRHRVETTLSWVTRLRRWAPITAISVERVRFDTQAMERPGIQGVEYQQGTLFGYELREYVLEKWGRSCAYCDAKNVPLNMDHIDPKARGGSLRVSNLAPSCVPCNQKKGATPLAEFLARDPVRLARIQTQRRRPLSDAAAVNTTRWALDSALRETGLPVEASSGGRTKYNRCRFGLPKTHALDAACVGVVGVVRRTDVVALAIYCTGRGTYQRTLSDKYGFPRRGQDGRPQVKTRSVGGFRTGDLVRALMPRAGVTIIGRVAIRESGKFALTLSDGSKRDVVMSYCQRLQRADGYRYGAVKKEDA